LKPLPKKEAIEKAAERFEIPPERRNRIAVQKMGKEKDCRLWGAAYSTCSLQALQFCC
jgi:hypothetical protein